MSVYARAAAATAAAIVIATPVVMKWEGKRNAVYRDVIGVETVCFGHTGPDVRMGQGPRSDKECARLLAHDMRKHAKPLETCLRADAPNELRGAFVSLAFNVGAALVCNSTAVRLANAGDYRGACAQLMRWNRANGYVVRGLTNRRADERQLCEAGLS